MIEAIIISGILKNIEFELFEILKKDLKDYLFTIEDINFLIKLENFIDFDEVMEKGLGNYIKELFEKNPELLKLHCDPYELFIDAGYLDSKLNVLK